MTASEHQAITVLTDMLRQFMADNSLAHTEIKNLVADVERRLCKKIEDQKVDVQAMAAHCAEREEEIDRILAQRSEMFEGEIHEAKMAAIAEAKKPSVVKTAGSLVGKRIWRVVLGLAVLLGLVSTLIVVLMNVGVLGD